MCFCVPRLLFALVLALACIPAGAAGTDSPAYRVVETTGPAHELLPKTCGVCHKDAAFRFFLVAAPDEKGLRAALERLTGALPSEGSQRPANPHAAIACLFCHIDDPGRTRSGPFTFRTLEGEPVSVDEVERLCALCHPGDQEHPRVLGSADPVPDLERAGLPVAGGRVRCTTCHEMHEQEVGPADVKPAYLVFAARSPASWVHGNRAACKACHPRALAPGEEAVFLEPDATARCVRCHTESHDRIHPVGVASTEDTYPMDFLDDPLDEEGRLTCSTCHDEVCYERVDPRNPRFLRGGPYVMPTDFCYRCHPRAGRGSLNPHDQVGEDGRIVSTTCVFCHRRVPEDPQGADFRPGDLLYLRSPVELCMGCHDPDPHPTVNHLVEMPEPMLQKLQRYEERHRVRLPLGPDRQVVCTTCHNPHEKGVLRGEAALGAGEENLWRVPSYAELCTPCHARYD